MATRTYNFESQKRLNIIAITLLGLWLGWMIATLKLTLWVYLKDNAPDTLVVITIACAIGLFAAWRQLMRGALMASEPFSLFNTFFAAVIMVCITFWAAPEVWVRLTASENVTREVTFTLEHPGPSTSRFSSCKAGMRFYDDELRRTMFFCGQDVNVPPGSQKVQVEKLMNAHGGRYRRYRYIRVDHSPAPWRIL